jgi:hypothetical protein
MILSGHKDGKDTKNSTPMQKIRMEIQCIVVMKGLSGRC